jgi:hypothetical protein
MQNAVYCGIISHTRKAVERTNSVAKEKHILAGEAKRVINREFARLGAQQIPTRTGSQEFARLTMWRTRPRHAWEALNRKEEAEAFLFKTARELGDGKQFTIYVNGVRFHVAHAA